MKILHLSDTHYLSQYSESYMEKVMKNQISFEAKLDIILNQVDISKIDLVAVTGDLTHESENVDEYTQLDVILKRYFKNIPIHYTLGNHDTKLAFNNAILGIDNKDCYDHDIILDNHHLIFLDSAKENLHKGKLDEDQLQWVRKTLEKNDFPKLIFMHQPFIWEGELENTMFENPSPFVDILKDFNIQGVFTGHTHQQGINTYNNITQFTSNGIGFGMSHFSDNRVAFTNTTGYQIIKIDDNQQLTVRNEIVTPQLETSIELEGNELQNIIEESEK